MNFRQVEVFFNVMTAGSITAAARKLGISQPSVTTTIKQAEQNLGFRLFERDSGRLIPTTEARVLFEEASRAHEALAAVNRLSEKLQDGIAGTVRVAATSSFCLEIIPDAIADFTSAWPNHSIFVATHNTDAILSRLDARSGTHHLGFTFGTGNYDGLSSNRIGSADLYCILPAGWKVAKGGTVVLNDLIGKPYISPEAATPLGMIVEDIFLQSGLEPATVATVHSHQLALDLVRRGIGFSILDTITVSSMLHGEHCDSVKIRRFESPVQLPLTAIFPAGRTLSNPSRHFLETVRRIYRRLQSEVKQIW